MIISVVGARPQFVKAAVVSRAFRKAGLSEGIVHTGQHYDDAMSGAFIRELGIDNIVAQFTCGGGTHAVQTAGIMTEFEGFLLAASARPELVVVYGDTNSTLAASIVACKLHIPIAHVEAGLRSFNREMPEEVNRIVTDHLSSIHFCSSEDGVQQLGKEGIHDRVHNVGDVMLDAFQHFTNIATQRPIPDSLARMASSKFGLVTIHRPSNTDVDEILIAILQQLDSVQCDFVWPVHPRLRDRIKRFEIPKRVHLVTPLPYFEMLQALERCHMVITDSGGLQKEAYWARKRCVTVRRETEWVETLRGGWNQLFDPLKDSLVGIVEFQPATPWAPIYGDGLSSEKISSVLNDWIQSST